MQFSDQVYVVGIVAAGSIIAALLTYAILRMMGVVKWGQSSTGLAVAGALPRLQRKIPEMANLPVAAQNQIALASVRHPVVICFAVGVLLGFIWLAIAMPAVLDAINTGSKPAGVIGMAVLGVIIFGMRFLGDRMARWKVKQYLTNHLR
jgi:hypothetical protein